MLNSPSHHCSNAIDHTHTTTHLRQTKTEMAKFSVSREAEDEEDEDELLMASEPDTKRRRISGDGSPSAASQSTRESSHPQAESNQSIQVFAREETRCLTDVDETLADGQISVILSNPDVLDCSICFDPLTIPVYQCPNGHIACSYCCTNLKNRCPSCCERIGNSRCRAIENVLESVKVCCAYRRYGCQEKVSYCSKLLHESTCVYAPYKCPFQDCVFRCSPKNLPSHLNQHHCSPVVNFCYNSVRSVYVKRDDKFVVLQEEKDGVLFILNFRNNSMSIRCISCTSSGDTRFAYALKLRNNSSTVGFESFAEKASQRLDDSPSVNFLHVPGYFFNSSGYLWLDVCIWSKNESLPDPSTVEASVIERKRTICYRD